MKRINFNVVAGALLVALGALMLLENLNILPRATGLFWGAIFIAGGGMFLYFMSGNVRTRWWAVIPGLTLLGLGLENFLPASWDSLGGALFLGSLGLSFLVVYLTGRERWWAVIPGGVLLTLAVIAGVEDSGLDAGSLLFVGLGLTFLLVGILPTPAGRMTWAFIPAAVLILLGAFLGGETLSGIMFYIVPAALVLAGLVFIYRFFADKE